MNAIPVLHGDVGNLDELLVCGVALAIILLVVLIIELRARPIEIGDTEGVDQKAAE